MVYQSARKKKQAQMFRKAMFLTIVAVAILAGASYGYMALLQDRVEVDPESMCPVSGPMEITAVFIDSTDPFSAIQQDYLSKYFSELLGSVETGAMIQVYSASDFATSGFEPIVSICDPGDGDEASEWTANPERIKKKWRELFDEPLRQSVLTGMTRDGADTSPLMKMIQSLSIQAFPLSKRDVSLNLVVVSDMLEHTADYSQYSDGNDFGAVARRPFFSHVTPNLAGVNVTVLYVARTRLERLQTTDHADFWGDYFSHFGAILLSIKRI